MKCLIDLTKEAQGDITTEVDDLISKQQAIEVKRTEVLERIQHSKLKIEVLMQQLVEKEEEHKYVEHLEKDASILHDTLEKKISEGLIMAKYYNYMSVNGHVNRIMLDDKLSNMSSKVNKLISKFIHIRCTFNINEMDKKRGIVVDITKNDKKISIKHLSGFELFVFDICTKLAIAEESSRCISNMFMIDEGLDVIDEDMWKRVDDILNLITERYNTMFIITHRDGIQDRYNRKIQIDNGNIINDELI
jgi:DNA repair exonuclease SbcCD ATPase subunit